MKIIKRKSLGIQRVYDIGVAQDHNFLIGNGLVASNCFNKSHSTAYAYVTYQTAYLKANYPVEYMAALLTASSGNQDKVEKYRENCQKMGIDVEPPDINRSQVDFTPVGNKILFGLSAVRNLGQGAIENILQAREEVGGGFKNLADLCSRVDLHVVNRRALETLILCGGFDSIEPNRNQLNEDLDLVIGWAQSRAKDREIGQTNLFDLVGNENSQEENNSISFENVPHAKPVADFSQQEKLKLEKELLGFYVSDHPLKSIQEAAQILSPINLSELVEQKSRKKVSAIVMLSSIKQIITKKGDPMAFVQMEDISGQAEGVVFPNIYERIEPVLVNDARLIVWGKVERRDDQIQLVVEDAEPIETVRMMMIELSSEQAINHSIQNNLKGILQRQYRDKNKAQIPVVAIIGRGRERQFVRLGQNFWVQDENTVVESLINAKFNVHIEPLIPRSSLSSTTESG